MWKRLQAQRQRPYPPGFLAVGEAAKGIRDATNLADIERRVREEAEK